MHGERLCKGWLVGVILAGISGCATHTGTGALAGSGLGALAGAAIGSATGNAGKGALIGAGLGAATGGLIGAAADENDRRNAERIAALQARGPALSIHDVVHMAQSGVSEDVIINQIRNSSSVFHLTPTDIANLHQQGVSDRVILAMQETCRQPVIIRRRPVIVEPAPVVIYEPCPPPVIGFSIYHRHRCW
jgi:surface antigen